MSIWFCVNKNGREMLFNKKPERYDFETNNKHKLDLIYRYIFITFNKVTKKVNTGCPLDYGTIEKLLGRKMTWQDEPIEFDILPTLKDGGFTP